MKEFVISALFSFIGGGVCYFLGFLMGQKSYAKRLIWMIRARGGSMIVRVQADDERFFHDTATQPASETVN